MKDYIAFLRACREGDAEKVSWLLPFNREQLNSNPGYPMPPGFLLPLPLIEAVRSGNREVMHLLLENGADPHIQCRKTGKSPAELMKGER